MIAATAASANDPRGGLMSGVNTWRRRASVSRGLQLAVLRARPTVFFDLSAFGERSAIALRDFRVVEREVQQEHFAGVGTAEIEARTHHANLVAYLQAITAGQIVGPLSVTGQLVGEEIVDDARFAPRVEQALPAIELGREHEPLLLAVHGDLRNGRQVTIDQRLQQRGVLDAIAQHALVAIEHLTLP